MSSLLIVIPTYNESAVIAHSILKLHEYIITHLSSVNVMVVVADNGSIDATCEVVRGLSQEYEYIELLEIPEKGKGLAIRSAWEKYGNNFTHLMFMDADLAVELSTIQQMLTALESHDIAISNRYHSASTTKRTLLRSTASRIFRFCMRTLLKSNISDFPCGCKMGKSEVIISTLTKVKNNQWFFDSELVYHLEQEGKSIAQLPVIWKDRDLQGESKVSVVKVGWEYLGEIYRLLVSR